MLVSVVTPTYNRRAFIPQAIECFKAQTWPQDQMEWLILDDGTDKVGDLFTSASLKNVRYITADKKLTIGAKRNRLNDLAKGNIIVCMDDDDYYPPDRVAHAVTSLQANPSCQIAGASEMYLNFVDRKEIWLSGPFGPNHGTNNTMAYWRSYTEDHRYDEEVAHAEERSFTNGWTEPMVQLNPKSTVLMTCHANNTFDKKILMKNPASVMRLVPWISV